MWMATALPDLIVTQLNAPPVLLRNVGANKNHFVRLDLTGFADNKTALGVKVEVFANGLWQKWELAGASGYQTQARAADSGRAWARREGIDLLRILWPTGVLQDEIDLPHTHGDRDEGSGPARQFVPGAVCVGWAQIQVRDRRDWRGGGGALVHARAAQYSQPRRVDQGGWRATLRR